MLIALFLTAIPFIFLGPVPPFFYIYNEDINKHEAVIEIFDSENESVFNKIYELKPEESKSQPKPLWLLLELSFPPGDKEKYEVRVTSDENITETRQLESQLSNSIDITLHNDTEFPITIGIMTV